MVDYYSSYVADTAEVDKLSVIKDAARVEGCSEVRGSEVSGSAVVKDSAVVRFSVVEDSAQIGGSVFMEWSHVGGSARVYGSAFLVGVYVLGNSCVFGDARLLSAAGDIGNVKLCGSCKFGGDATFEGLVTHADFIGKYGADKVQVRDGMVILTDVWDMG